MAIEDKKDPRCELELEEFSKEGIKANKKRKVEIGGSKNGEKSAKIKWQDSIKNPVKNKQEELNLCELEEELEDAIGNAWGKKWTRAVIIGNLRQLTYFP